MKFAILITLKIALFSMLTCIASATELTPWFSPQLENEFRNTLIYQTFRKVSEGSHYTKYSSDDLFLTLSITDSPYPEWSFELEGTVAKTRHKSNGFDNLRATARYLWLNDVAGDPVSLTSGVTITIPTEGSLHDVSSFHHGLIEAEFHTAIGREHSCGEIWTSRWCAIAAIGIADRGSPWLRGNLEYDWRMSENNELKAYINGLWGLGKSDLHLCHFKGYGPVRHQSVDLGLRYAHEIDCFGELSIEYAYRVFARNFPVNAQFIVLELVYPFAL